MVRISNSLLSLLFSLTSLWPLWRLTLACGGCGHNYGWRREDRHGDEEGCAKGHLHLFSSKYGKPPSLHLLGSRTFLHHFCHILKSKDYLHLSTPIIIVLAYENRHRCWKISIRGSHLNFGIQWSWTSALNTNLLEQ